MRMCACVAVGVLGLLARTSDAGRTAFAWPYDTDTLKPMKAELQTWLTEEDHDGHSETSLWWLPVIGLTSQLELALPSVFTQTRDGSTTSAFELARYGVELRYRFAPLVNPPAFVPLVRVAAFREVADRTAIRVEADAVVSYTSGAVHAVADVSYAGLLHSGVDVHEVYPSIGISFGVSKELRLGVEATAELDGEGGGAPTDFEWLIAGPDIAWTHGRFWLSATSGIGITGIRAAPRMLLGVLF